MSHTAQRLTARQLNRATLHRQMLLSRADLPVVPAVEHLLGLNAQDPNPPYLALWSRLTAFRIQDLTEGIESHALVRSTMMRATQHLVSTADFPFLRAALAPLLRRVQRTAFGSRTRGVDLEALVTEAREILAAEKVLTRPMLGRLLAQSRPGVEPSALGWSVQYLLPLIHPAPSGTWNVRGATPFALADWTGVRSAATKEDVRRLVHRYLAAFGPASVPDARVWSGAPGLREVFAELRPELRVFRDEEGRELYDLPDAPLPPEDTPAPVRLLPEFDATVLAHADRRRVMTDEVRALVCDGAAVAATVLVDGTVAGTWTRTSGKDTAAVTVRAIRPLTEEERANIESEAHRLLGFTDPDAGEWDVRVSPAA
ncbi:AlkZ family DNA glycosylase [Spiractinospora alimapuensis]|uniref:winged helix DNA-binding domain-containing protein n=1 Tax=Spiractinospora alimapuensis TaxID=2820884 RepID=UPI001F226FBC|nr:winged helix DNA-binding domain-containing protein [Spiractinospora alimapuensis]QVQ54545.1 AlkZ family DNA glycosylase [Spiractinospora alimapuensis]